MNENDNALDLINKQLYPLHRPESAAYKTLVERCREELTTQSACVLGNFITKEATKTMVAEVDQVAPNAYSSSEKHNIFFEDNDDNFPSDHPRRRPQMTKLDSVAFDQISCKDGLHRLYSWEPLLSFIASVLRKKQYYRMADPLAALTVNIMHQGQIQGWHFDESEVTTTLMLQAAETGGVFEYAPNVRPDESGSYEILDQVLSGCYPGIRTLKVDPGTLILFVGYRSIHQVTRVSGDVTRYVATLCYKDEPDVCNSPEVQKLFYGRIA